MVQNRSGSLHKKPFYLHQKFFTNSTFLLQNTSWADTFYLNHNHESYEGDNYNNFKDDSSLNNNDHSLNKNHNSNERSNMNGDIDVNEDYDNNSNENDYNLNRKDCNLSESDNLSKDDNVHIYSVKYCASISITRMRIIRRVMTGFDPDFVT